MEAVQHNVELSEIRLHVEITSGWKALASSSDANRPVRALEEVGFHSASNRRLLSAILCIILLDRAIILLVRNNPDL